jgi:hypothetical protein
MAVPRWVLIDIGVSIQWVTCNARNTGKTPGSAAFFFWCGAVEYDSSYV